MKPGQSWSLTDRLFLGLASYMSAPLLMRIVAFVHTGRCADLAQLELTWCVLCVRHKGQIATCMYVYSRPVLSAQLWNCVVYQMLRAPCTLSAIARVGAEAGRVRGR